MEQTWDLTALEEQQVDPEVFRRVWARVMEDRSDGPIAVEPPARGKPSEEHGDGRRRASDQEREPGEQVLRRLIDLAQEGVLAGQAVSRRAGRYARGLATLTADHQRAVRQLSAAHFLECGWWYQSKTGMPARSGALAMALREQFLWECQWGRACLKGAEGLTDPAQQELCRELAQDAALHGRAIRGVLERMQMGGGSVDWSGQMG